MQVSRYIYSYDVVSNTVHGFSFFRYMLQYLAEKGFTFKGVDDNNQSPLHHACSFGHLEAFKFLMKNGVNYAF